MGSRRTSANTQQHRTLRLPQRFLVAVLGPPLPHKMVHEIQLCSLIGSRRRDVDQRAGHLHAWSFSFRGRMVDE